MKVPIVQFMRPGGRQVPESIELPMVTPEQIQAIDDAGCRLTAEVLLNGKCSFCIEEPELGNFAQKICENGPAMPVVLTEMIQRFNRASFNAWKDEANAQNVEPEF